METPKCIQDEIASLRGKIGACKALTPAVVAVEEALRSAGCAAEWNQLAPYTGSDTTYLSVHASVADYKQVGQFGRRLRQFGFRLLGQHDQGSTRVVDYDGPITVFFSFSGPANCRYVKVGEKTQPVYELRCE